MYYNSHQVNLLHSCHNLCTILPTDTVVQRIHGYLIIRQHLYITTLASPTCAACLTRRHTSLYTIALPTCGLTAVMNTSSSWRVSTSASLLLPAGCTLGVTGREPPFELALSGNLKVGENREPVLAGESSPSEKSANRQNMWGAASYSDVYKCSSWGSSSTTRQSWPRLLTYWPPHPKADLLSVSIQYLSITSQVNYSFCNLTMCQIKRYQLLNTSQNYSHYTVNLSIASRSMK